VADAQLFAASNLLRGVRADMLEELAARFGTKKCDEGQTILAEGESFRADRDCVYFIAKGQVELWKIGNVVCQLDVGDVFGELAAFGRKGEDVPEVQPVSVKSKTKVILRTILAQELKSVLRTHRDEDLDKQWREQTEERWALLNHKVHLNSQLRLKTTNMDFMFMKLPTLRDDGSRAPTNATLQETIAESCAAIKDPAAGIIVPVGGRIKSPNTMLPLPPLTAR